MKKVICAVLITTVATAVININVYCQNTLNKIEIPILQDTYIETANPADDYSAEAELYIINERTRRYGYMMFDLSEVSGQITSAKLVCEVKRVNDDSNPSKIRLRKAETDWIESEVCL